MASYSCSVQTISRSQGRSAPGAAAYRHGVALIDDRTGERFDYTKRWGVEAQGLEGATDLAALWRAAEAAEKRGNSVVAREVRFSLPHEISADERARISREVSTDLRARFGVAVSWANHEPGREGDSRNFHCHLLATTRVVDVNGTFGAKTRELDAMKSTGGAAVEDIRRIVEDRCNDALERAGLPRSMDRRSLAAQAEAGEIAPDEAVPTRHLGPAAAALERRGIATEAGGHNRAVVQLRAIAREAAQVANDLAIEERRIAAERKPEPAGDVEVMDFPDVETIEAAAAQLEAEAMRRLAEQRQAEQAEVARRLRLEAQARAEATRRATRDRAIASIQEAVAAEARATTTRRKAATAIAAVEGAADAVCDAITIGAPAARAAAGRAWVAERRAPYVTAASAAYVALEAARKALLAHGQPPSWWRLFQRLAWDRQHSALSAAVGVAEDRHGRATDRLHDEERATAGPTPQQHQAGEQAAQECITQARRAYRQAVAAASAAVNAAVEPATTAWDAWRAMEAARAAEASYGSPGPIPALSLPNQEQREADLAVIRAWLNGERPVTDPVLRAQALTRQQEAPEPGDCNPAIKS